MNSELKVELEELLDDMEDMESYGFLPAQRALAGTYSTELKGILTRHE